MAKQQSGMQRFLDVIERVGNRVPHPVVIFLVLIAAVIVLSHAFHLSGTAVAFQVVNPETHAIEDATASVNSLLTGRRAALHADLGGAELPRASPRSAWSSSRWSAWGSPRRRA